MYYPNYVIEQVREQTDILSIISEYTSLTQRGSNYVGLCPFHHEKTPSFSVSGEKQMYYCFGCGAGGNVITFMMQKENMSFPEAIDYLAERAHITVNLEEVSKEAIEKQNKKQLLMEIHTKAARFFYHTLMEKPHQHVIAYLEKRGMDKKIIKHFGIGYASPNYNILYDYLKNQGYQDDLILESGLVLKSKKGTLFDRFSDRVMFPIFNVNKKVIAFGGRIIEEGSPKYLNSPESLLFDKSQTLYGLNWAREQKHPYFILVEGYMDVIAMHRAGFTQTVASLGTAFTLAHAKLLKRYTEEVVILYDSDLAGNQAALRAMPILKSVNLRVRVLQLGEQKDPDEYFKKHTTEQMLQLLEHCQSDTWFKIGKEKEQYQLEYPEQKIKFLQETAKIISELNSSIEQSVYIKELAKNYQIDELALESEVKKCYNRSLGRHQSLPLNKTKSIQASNISVVQIDLLSVLYHYPRIYQVVKAYLSPDLFDKGVLEDIAKHMFEALEQNKEINIDYFNNTYTVMQEQMAISKVFMNKDVRYEEEELLQKMVTETIKRLNKQYIEKKLKQTTHIKEVQELLERKKLLDTLYIAFGNG